MVEMEVSPSPDTPAAAVERAMIIAQAKLLVEQLDTYLGLIADWAIEGLENDSDEPTT